MRMSGLGCLTVALLVMLAGEPATAQITTPIGKSNGAAVNARNTDMTPDGRFVVYDSFNSTLVPGDTNGAFDCFLYDRTLDSVIRVSVAAGGGQATGTSNIGSSNPSVSDDGTRIAFHSWATNLVPLDANANRDVFVRDLATDETRLVSVDSSGGQGNGGSFNAQISGDGRYVVFQSSAENLVVGDTNLVDDIFVHELETSQTIRVSVSSSGLQGDGYSGTPSISSTGRYVSFQSDATTLTVNDANGVTDIFVADLMTNLTTLVSKSTSGQPADGSCDWASLSGNGAYVVFNSRANSLDGVETSGSDRDIFRHELASGITERVTLNPQGLESSGAIFQGAKLSDSGESVVFTGSGTDLSDTTDNNGMHDVFVRDMSAGKTALISLLTGGTEPTGGTYSALPSDPRYVVFASNNTLYLRDTFIPWADLGAALAGSNGLPVLTGTGTLEGNTIVQLALTDALPNAAAFLVGSPFLLHASFEGGVLVPRPDKVLGFTTDVAGVISFPVLWPPGIASGAALYLQYWIPDAGGLHGYAASNALSATQP